MSRIYQGGSAESRYRQTDLGQGYRPQRAQSNERAAKEWRQRVIEDGNTRLRDLERKTQAENTQSRLEMQVEISGLKQQQLAEEIELEMDQQYEKDILKQEQTHEGLEMKLDSAELQAKHQVQNANMSAMKGAVSSILSFAGSAMQYAQVQGEIDAREQAKQDLIDSGAWAFESDFDASSPVGSSVVEQSNNQSLVEISEETAIASTGLNPVDQESLRQTVGIGQSDARVQRQISLGEASATIGTRITQAFNDPNRRITIIDQATGQPKTIRPMDAKSYELPQVAMALGQQLTREMGVANADRYTAVKQYVPQLQNAINNLVAREQAGRLAGEQATRESAGFTRAAQVMATGDIGGAWAAYYEAAATSGIYKGDQVKITKAAVEAMVQDATPAQLEQLKNGNYRVFEGGPTFANDKRFAGLIDEAIRDKNKGLITDFNQNEKFQQIELSNATNSFQEALMNADSPEATTQAHQAYETQLEALAAAGNGKARVELAKQLGRSNNYNPDNANNLRSRIEAGETFTEDFLIGELASGRINSNEFADIKRMGLATPEQKAKVYGGKEARNASNARGKSMVSQTLIKANPFLETAPTDIRSGIVSNISQDIDKRRDLAVKGYVEAAQQATGQIPGPGDVQKFADDWLQKNVPLLLDGVQVDETNGAVTGYQYLGASEPQKVGGFSSAYIKNPDGSPYQAFNYSQLSPQKLAAVANSGTSINYAGDSILTRQEKLAGAKAYVSGQAFPPSIVSKATALGVTPAYLVREQARGIGKELGALPTQQPPSQIQKTGLNGASLEPTNMEQGAAVLQQMGVPTKGAAYLAGNIQQESGWNGMRDWGQVMGDGTSRNGGLVSWASWANDPARLGKIEAYLGKDISKATHTEQLRAMMWEMQTSYKSAYRVFMNPLATDAQLRRASYQYWGYGHEGARFQYSRQLYSKSLI
jgi:hypothetical protein